MDIVVIVIVKTQAHPLPLKRPHATRKLAIEIPISIPPIRPIYRPSNTKTELVRKHNISTVHIYRNIAFTIRSVTDFKLI